MGKIHFLFYFFNGDWEVLTFWRFCVVYPTNFKLCRFTDRVIYYHHYQNLTMPWIELAFQYKPISYLLKQKKKYLFARCTTSLLLCWRVRLEKREWLIFKSSIDFLQNILFALPLRSSLKEGRDFLLFLPKERCNSLKAFTLGWSNILSNFNKKIIFSKPLPSNSILLFYFIKIIFYYYFIIIIF